MRKVTLAIALAALVLFAGCNKDKETQGTTLKASIEQQKGDSKTSLNPTDGAINWTAGDKIIVYNGTSSATFTLSAGAGSTNGTFNYAGEFEITDDTKAVYPETCVITDNGMTFTLPEEQNLASPGSFANGANPMLGIKAGDGFTFVSVCGGLGLSLTGDNVDITAIEIVSENEMLTGTYTGYFNNDNIDVANGTNSVRLNCTTTLTAEPKEFYIVLPVGVLSNGFTLNIYNGTADPIFTKTTTTDLTVELNKVKKMNTLNVVPTVAPTVPEGAINGKFTINANGDQVYFSKGNLMYIGSETPRYWKFADNQWDYCDLYGYQSSFAEDHNYGRFSWGTSGYNHGAVYYQPWNSGRYDVLPAAWQHYYAYGQENGNLYDQTGQADWGYNAINNGGNTENSGWRTLTGDEWVYVVYTRSTASGIRFAKAIVNGINGMVFLPDDWNSNYFSLNNTNSFDASFSSNNITENQWVALEQHGALFLPGRTYGASYWSSSSNENSSLAIGLTFDDSWGDVGAPYKWEACFVRLVRNAE